MSKNEKAFGKDFKTKDCLEALEEKETLEVLYKKYILPPRFIVKAEAIKNISAVFNQERVTQKKSYEKLLQRTGQLTLENDFLKKS
jgi:hypothetical protein